MTVQLDYIRENKALRQLAKWSAVDSELDLAVASTSTLSVMFRRLRKLIRPPIYIFQMGKVGSSSIQATLKAHCPNLVFHAHSEEGMAEKARSIFRFRKRLRARIFMICPVREPLSRNISAFFQNFLRDTGMKPSDKEFGVEEVIQMFLNHYPHHVFLEWFDKQLRPLTGIDVLAEPFPKERMWKTYSKGGIRLLVYRSDMDRVTQLKVISEFLEDEALELEWKLANRGSDKDYADLYRRVQHEGKLPDIYMKLMCESRICRHFWTDDEIESFKEKWV